MKQRVVPGGEIDAVTGGEFRELAQVLLRKDTMERVRASEVGALDGDGNGSVDIYGPPLGMEFRLCRLIVEANGYTYAAMFTNAAGSVAIKRGDVTVDGYNLAAGIPNAWSAGPGSAPRYKNGERVTVAIVGGPADVSVTVSIEGDQFPKGGES